MPNNVNPTAQERMHRLIEEVLELSNVVAADLETGSHYGNNAAFVRFGTDHRILSDYLVELQRQAYMLKLTLEEEEKMK